VLQHKVFDSHGKQFLSESKQIVEGEERRMYCGANLVTNSACEESPQALKGTFATAYDPGDLRVDGKWGLYIKTKRSTRGIWLSSVPC